MKVLTDSYGIVGQPKAGYKDNIEGGDSMNWTAHYMFLTEYDQWRLYNYIEYFEDKGNPGLYIRHPHQDNSFLGWARFCLGNWFGVESRDQMTGKLALFIKYRHHPMAREAAQRCLDRHRERYYLFANNTIHNNTDPHNYKFNLFKLFSKRREPHRQVSQHYRAPDFTGPEIWGMYIRALRKEKLYWALWMCDLQIALGALFVHYTDRNDIISWVIKWLSATTEQPSWMIKFMNFFINKELILTKLHSYWHKRDQPGMFYLYENYIINTKGV